MESFSSLKALQKLDLSYSNLASTSAFLALAEGMKGMKNLQLLILSSLGATSNQLGLIAGAFNQTESLTSLDVSYNTLGFPDNTLSNYTFFMENLPFLPLQDLNIFDNSFGSDEMGLPFLQIVDSFANALEKMPFLRSLNMGAQAQTSSGGYLVRR